MRRGIFLCLIFLSSMLYGQRISAVKAYASLSQYRLKSEGKHPDGGTTQSTTSIAPRLGMGVNINLKDEHPFFFEYNLFYYKENFNRELIYFVNWDIGYGTLSTTQLESDVMQNQFLFVLKSKRNRSNFKMGLNYSAVLYSKSVNTRPDVRSYFTGGEGDRFYYHQLGLQVGFAFNIVQRLCIGFDYMKDLNPRYFSGEAYGYNGQGRGDNSNVHRTMWALSIGYIFRVKKKEEGTETQEAE